MFCSGFNGRILNLYIHLRRIEVVMIQSVLIHEHGTLKIYLDLQFLPIQLYNFLRSLADLSLD